MTHALRALALGLMLFAPGWARAQSLAESPVAGGGYASLLTIGCLADGVAKVAGVAVSLGQVAPCSAANPLAVRLAAGPGSSAAAPSYVAPGTGATFAVADPNNASFSSLAVLAAGTTLPPASAGRSFGWACAGAGLGTITTADGTTVPFYFYATSGGFQRGDALAVIAWAPGTASGCTFWTVK